MTVSKNPKMQYLKQRGGAWYLNHPIPKDVQGAYLTSGGKTQTHIVRALGTTDVKEAYRRKLVMLPALMAEFEQRKREVRGIVPSDLAEAIAFRDQLREASNADNFTLADTLATVITDRAERIHRDGGQTAQSLQKARVFVRIAEGAETLTEAFEDWLGRGNLPLRTRAKYRTALDEFVSFIGGAALIADMNRQNAIRYVDWLNAEGRSQRTKKVVPLSYNSKRDRVMALSAFWNKGLSARGKTTDPSNPWSKLEVTEKPTSPATRWDSLGSAGRPKRRQGFDDADLLAILAAPGPRQSSATKYTKRTIVEVLTLGLLTGARPDEVCSLKLGDVRKTKEGYILNVEDAKNEDSDRRVPLVHPLAVKLINRRIGKRRNPGEQLFEEFRPKQGHESMYELVGRALSRHLRRAEGITGEYVPYCTRHTLQSLMGNREDIKDAVMQRYVGHRPTGMTDKHYREISAESLLAFARKVRYSPKVERRMAEELGI
jgi:integrase